MAHKVLGFYQSTTLNRGLANWSWSSAAGRQSDKF